MFGMLLNAGYGLLGGMVSGRLECFVGLSLLLVAGRTFHYARLVDMLPKILIHKKNKIN